MNLVNNTNSTVFWTVSSPGQSDCGTLEPHGKFYFPVPVGPTYDVRFSPREPTFFQTNAQGDQTVAIAVTASNAAATGSESAQPEAAATS